MSTDAGTVGGEAESPKADSPRALGQARMVGLKTIVIREYSRIIRESGIKAE